MWYNINVMDIKSFIKRIQNIITEPQREFIRISKEEKNPIQVFLDFILPFMVLYAIASYLGKIIFSPATFSVGTGIILKNILLIILVILSGIYLAALVLNEILPAFHTKRSFSKTFGMISYSLTPVFIAIIFSGLIPNLSMFINLVGLYSIILFWISAAAIIDMTKDRRQIYVPISLLSMVVIFLVIRVILGAIFSL